jgi:PEP-CTERM motif
LKNAIHALALAALTGAAVNAGAVEINFDDLAVGTQLSTQYSGVVFSANALAGDLYATNTDMTIVSSLGPDVIGLGKPNLVSGNVLRSYSAWLNETGDPSFRISFSDAIASFSADFAGVFTSSGVQLLAYDGSTLLGSTAGTSNKAQFTLSIAGEHITSVVVVPGTLDDYVAVDDIQYTAAAVPEPSTWALSTMGLGFVAWASRRKKHRRV